MDWTEIIIAVVGIISLIIEGFFIGALNHKRKKELESIKNDHSKLVIKLEHYEKQIVSYNNHKTTIISNFLGDSKAYLANPDSDDAYIDYAKSSSQILMYLSNTEQINGAKLMINIIDDIHSIEIGYCDGSWERRDSLVQEAFKIHHNLCELFSDLGLKPPTPPQE